MEKVVLYVTSIDDSMVNKTVCGFTFKKLYLNNQMYTSEELEILRKANDTFNWFYFGVPNNLNSFIHHDDRGTFIYYMIKEYLDIVHCREDVAKVIRLLSIYKESAISFTGHYLLGSARIVNEVDENVFKCINNRGKFSIEDNEITRIQQLY